MAATRWGILGLGKIASDFVTALQLLPTTEHQVVAVASRSLDKATVFAERFKIPRAYGSYDELSKDSGVDIVYVGNIQTYHCDACKVMLHGGRSVLCEKPLGLNSREVDEMLTLAKEKKVFLMEGFWSRFFPVYSKIRETLASGVLGQPRLVQASLGFSMIESDISKLELGGGALLGLGCYPIQLADMVFGGKPETIQATGDLYSTGVDDLSAVTLKYPGGGLAVLNSAASLTLTNRAIIECTKGRIEIPTNFWCPSEVVINGETVRYPLPECSAPLNYPNSQGFVYEAQHVREMLLSGRLESPLLTHESIRTISHILTEARRQLGVIYPADKI